MSSVVIKGNTSGQVTLNAPDVAGTTVLTLPTTSGTVALTSEIKQIGVGQTWQNVTGSRTSGTTYTNSTGKPIMVSINIGSGSCVAVVGGVTLFNISAANGNTSTQNSFIVPEGATYSITAGGISVWAELR